MIVDYVDNTIIINVDEVVLNTAEFIGMNIVMSFAKFILDDGAEKAAYIYNECCKPMAENIGCKVLNLHANFNQEIISTIDKVGGVFAITSALFILKACIELKSRVSRHYPHQSINE